MAGTDYDKVSSGSEYYMSGSESSDEDQESISGARKKSATSLPAKTQAWTTEIRAAYAEIFVPRVKVKLLKKSEILDLKNQHSLLITFPYNKIRNKILANKRSAV